MSLEGLKNTADEP